jgi:uncharacterized repeat protein (TIGR03803 family)
LVPKSTSGSVEIRLPGAIRTFALTALAATAAAAPALAASRGYTVLYNFTDGNDGGYSQAGLIQDKAGNLYGTTHLGGADNAGTVFEVAPDGVETVLYAFGNGSDGGYPTAGLVRDKAGNLYGTTYGGGSGDGVVFRLAPDGTETVLHAFTGGGDGANPLGGLIEDKAGDLYGTTTYGGSANDGTVFEIAADGTETVLYAFTGGADQANPVASLIEDKSGNLYGTTCSGLGGQHGTVFEVSKKGSYTTLHSFNGADDGECLQAGLLRDGAGNLYGTATYEGAGGAGVVFKLTPGGTETVLYPFTGGKDGGYPVSNLVQDKSGNFYGTTEGGGANGGGVNGPGVVFKLASDGTESALYKFKGGNGGANPEAGLVAGKGKMLYGTARNAGAAGAGVVFSLKE